MRTVRESEAGKRCRRRLDDWGDGLDPLFAFLGVTDGARACARSLAALFLANIYLVKGSLPLARAYLELAASIHPESSLPQLRRLAWVTRAGLDDRERRTGAICTAERSEHEYGRGIGGIAVSPAGASAPPNGTADPGGGLVAVDMRFRALLEEIREAARYDVPILLLGEPGTGKDAVARCIHSWSGCAREPFIAVNAASLSDSLFASALFGHVRGAFTGAVANRPGILESAGRGIVFLDEIGDLEFSLQAKLLRVLENGEYMAVGDPRVRRSRARIVAATNRDLDQAVAEGSFRADLFHRLDVLSFRIPPLRERIGDILPLADRFLSDAAARFSAGPFHVGEAARRLLQEHDWPGNIRQLKNEMTRAALACRRGAIDVWHLSLRPPVVPHGSKVVGGTLDERIESAEREEIYAALMRCRGNRTRAAGELGIGRTTLLYRMRKLGLE